MASDILHIKDGYYFDVPKFLWRSNYKEPGEFPAWFLRLDPDFQIWEADRTIQALKVVGIEASKLEGLKEEWSHWQHQNHKNHGWPLWAYVESRLDDVAKKATRWAKSQSQPPRDPVVAYLAEHPEEQYGWVHKLLHDPAVSKSWDAWKRGNASRGR